MAPLRRAAYDRDLDVAAALATDAGLRRWASDGERAEPTSGGENDPVDPSSAYALFVARHGITERTEWAAQLAREYNDALFRAYMGPRVRHCKRHATDVRSALTLTHASPARTHAFNLHVRQWTPTDARQFPCDFEAEQRSTPDEPDLLHLVSGRQLLGRVVLATASRTAPRLSPASDKSDTPPLEHAASDATELHFQGSCVARAHRVPVPGRGPDYYTLRVYLPASTAVVGLESGGGGGHDATMECRAQVHGIDRRGRWSVLAVSDAVGRVAYRVRLFGTLLVRDVVITNADGKSVAHIARARLPPRALWLWEARAQTHGRAGSWLFDLSDKDERYIHPAVPVLLAAYLSLDEEQRGPQGLARLGHWWRHR